MFAQEVCLTLGNPDAIYRKVTDKLKIHDDAKGDEEIYHEYFYNYFELGLDLLFSERDHCVTRLILHTNAPNSAVFNHYNKADFTLHLKDKQVRANTPWAEIQALGPDGPIVHEPGSSVNPFGPTKYYGLDGVIFELLPGNRLGSVTAFA